MWKFSELEYKRPDKDEVVKLITENTEAVRNASSGEEVVFPAPLRPTKQLTFSDNCKSADSQFLKLVSLSSWRYMVY